MGDFPNPFISKSRNVRVKPSLRNHGRRPRRVRVPVDYVWPTTAPGVDIPHRALNHDQNVFRVSSVEIKTFVVPPIMWIGEDYADLFAKGALYNFSCKWFTDTDLSTVHQAKGIVVSCTDVTPKVLSLVNFACEYGIPSIWLHRHLPPEVCYWNFTHRIHLDDSNMFWRDICQIIA